MTLIHILIILIMAAMSESRKCFGFLGCGKISSAMCRGYSSSDPAVRPSKILVSRRSSDKSAALAKEYPDIVEVVDSNEQIVAEADVIFIGLLPAVAREVLPTLSFAPGKLVLSMMAAVDYSEVLALTRCAEESIVRIVPLPSSAKRCGPILMYPSNANADSMLSIVGTPVVCTSESEMKPLISVTGHISSFYELLRITQNWTVRNGN
jgi:pyrroline-5-carboxylate reductase